MERAPQTLVIDASVAAMWFIPEEESEKAIRLRNAHVEGTLSLMAPDLIVYEVANALRYHPEIAEEDLEKDIDSLFMLDLDLVVPSSELTSSMVAEARKHEVSAYDSSYLVLTQVTATCLVTADRKLYDRVKDTDRVLLLEELDRKWSI